MNPCRILKAEWRRSWLGMLALALILGLSVSVGLAFSMLERGLRHGAARAGDDFDVLIGASGSAVQLLLSSVYLQAQALPLLPHETLAQTIDNPGTVWAAPLAFGDRWKNSPIVGTTPNMATLNGKRPLAEGIVFGEHNNAMTEAVVGSDVPLNVGDTFTPIHGRIALPDGDHAHDNVNITVVGRMAATGTPWDKAILMPLAAVWESHGLHEGDEAAGISAIVVKPRTIADAYKLRATWQTSATQAVFSGEVLTELFATLGDVRLMMQSMSAVTQGLAIGGVILATLFAVALRRDTLSLLRTLGAPRYYLMLTIWGLAGSVILLGVTAGVLLSLAEAHMAAMLIEQRTATAMPLQFTTQEWRMVALFALAGLAAACLPVVQGRRGE